MGQTALGGQANIDNYINGGFADDLVIYSLKKPDLTSTD